MKLDDITNELLAAYYVLDVTGVEALKTISEELAAGQFAENIQDWGITPLEFVYAVINTAQAMEHAGMLFKPALKYYKK